MLNWICRSDPLRSAVKVWANRFAPSLKSESVFGPGHWYVEIDPGGAGADGQAPAVSPCFLWPFTADLATVIVCPLWQSVTLSFLCLPLPLPRPPFLASVLPVPSVGRPVKAEPASRRRALRR